MRQRVRRQVVAGVGCLLVLAAGQAVPARLLHGQAAPRCPWMDASRPPDERAKLLLAAMTLDQKVAMTRGDGGSPGVGHVAGIAALCIPYLGMGDAGGGVGNGNTNVTAFPAPISQAAMFDPNVQYQFGQAVAQEQIGKGRQVWLAPDVNMARVPMNGRNFEAFGEDPYLSGQTAVPIIEGAQSQPVIATVKHYLANNQETNRDYGSSTIDERTLQEIYLPHFEAAVKQAHVGSVMCSYNRVNQVYACNNTAALTNILKQQFGFDGFVMSDWGASVTPPTPTEANAGLDMEMPFGAAFGTLSEAVQAGIVPASRLDDMAFRILRTMFRQGLFEHPLGPVQANVSTPQHRQLALQMAENGSVLLRNTGVLPLSARHQKIAVIGDVGHGGGTDICSGGGSSSVSCSPVSSLDGITQRAQANGDSVVFDNAHSITTAAAAAGSADIAIVFANDSESEGADRPSLALGSAGRTCTPGVVVCVASNPTAPDQDQLIEAVAAANKHTVVVLETGGPVLMPWLQQVAGVLEAWYPGMELGTAIAAILFGDVNPSGRLPETFPASMKDLPTAASPLQYNAYSPEIRYSEGLDIGYRWYDDKRIQPLFPFGFGLSYTTFRYDNLSVTSARVAVGQATVSFDVTNIGPRAGSEIAQVYVGAPVNNYVGEPAKQLRAYQRVTLQPGQTAHVSRQIDSRAVSYWDTATHGWKAETGCHPVLVGASSRDIRLTAPGVDGSLHSCGGAITEAAGAPGPVQASAGPGLANTTSSGLAAAPAASAGGALAGLVLIARRRRRRR